MHMGMKMYFHIGYETNLVFWNWSPESVWEMVLTCIVMIVTSVLYEWCKHLRMKQIATTRSSDYQRMSESRQEVQEPVPEIQDQEAQATTSEPQEKPKRSLANRAAAYARDLKCPCHIKQSIFYLLEVFISVMLMLAIMTFNVWIVLSVVLGRGAGYFMFSRSTNRIVLGSESDCCT